MPFDRLRANDLVRVPLDRLRACPVLDAGANVLAKVPFDKLRANVRAEVNIPFVLSLSKYFLG